MTGERWVGALDATPDRVVTLTELATERARLDALGIADVAGLQTALDEDDASLAAEANRIDGEIAAERARVDEILARPPYTTNEHDKLAGIEAGATADLTGAEIAALYEAQADRNPYTDGEQAKLAGLEEGKFKGRFTAVDFATALSDLTAAYPSPASGSSADISDGATVKTAVWNGANWVEDAAATTGETAGSIKTKYESNTNTNAFTDADQSALAGLQAALDAISSLTVYTDTTPPALPVKGTAPGHRIVLTYATMGNLTQALPDPTGLADGTRLADLIVDTTGIDDRLVELTTPAGTVMGVGAGGQPLVLDGASLSLYRFSVVGNAIVLDERVLSSGQSSPRAPNITTLSFANATTLTHTMSTSDGSDYKVTYPGKAAITLASGEAHSEALGGSTTGDAIFETVAGASFISEINAMAGGWSFDIADAPSELKYLDVLGSNTISGNLADAPSGLTYLRLAGSSTLSGDLANAPSGLTYLYASGSNTLSGSIADAPSGMTNLYVYGSNTISGDISGAPSTLTLLRLVGSTTLSGDISGAPSGMTYLSIAGANTVSGDISGAPSGLTYLYVTGANTLTGDISGAPGTLTNVTITGSNTITGDVADAPSGLTYLSVTGSNTLSGSIADAPSGLTTLSIAGTTTLSGDIDDAPSGLTYLSVTGSNTLSGDLANAPTGLATIVIEGSNTLTITARPNWPTTMAIVNLGAGSHDSTGIEYLLQELASVTTWTTPKTVDISGTGVTIADPSQSKTYIDTITANGGVVIYDAV